MHRRSWLAAGGAMTVLAVGLGGWYASPPGRAARLRGLDTPELMTYTAEHPQDAAVLVVLAERMEHQDHQTEALNDYLQAARAQPEAVSAWLGAARTALRLGDGETALKASQQA